jgi:hypothetical protein
MGRQCVIVSQGSGVVAGLRRGPDDWSIVEPAGAGQSARKALHAEAVRHHRESRKALYNFDTATSTEAAVDVADRAIASRPDEPLAWLHKAIYCHKAKLPVAADHAYRRFRELKYRETSPIAPLIDAMPPDDIGGAVNSLVASGRRLNALLGELAERRSRECNPELASFAREVHEFRLRRERLGDHTSRLFNGRSDVPPTINQYMIALYAERTLDFSQVQAERSSLISLLVEHLDEQERSILLTRSKAFRAGAVSATEFYTDLRALIDRHEINVSRWPKLSAYFDYVTASRWLDYPALISEIWDAELERLSGLCISAEESQLMEDIGDTILLDRLRAYLVDEVGVVHLAANRAPNPMAFDQLRPAPSQEQEAQAPPARLSIWQSIHGFWSRRRVT